MLTKIQDAKNFIEKKFPKGFNPTIGVVLGSGLGHYVSFLKNTF
jgi:purine nucleoside phosphorylase